MDAVVKIKEGKITVNLFCKPSDGHQYLYYDFCYAENKKRSIVFSQTFRLRRICFQKNDIDSYLENLKEFLKKRSYPEQLIKDQVTRGF